MALPPWPLLYFTRVGLNRVARVRCTLAAVGRVIDGEWSNHDLGADAQGRYVRRAAGFRGRIAADGSSPFTPEAGRYHLYVSWACGWSHRTLIFRQLKGLVEAIPVSMTQAFMGEHGWTFADGGDPLGGKDKLYEIYVAAKPDYTGRASVPVLWDKKTATIVSNESTDIARDFDGPMAAAGGGGDALWPADQAAAIDAMIDANYGAVNNAVYRAGFAGSQAAHEEAARELFTRLDALEEHLARHRYLVGDRVTAADWFLFTTLYRFDAIYTVHFKCNLRRLVDYPNLWAYTRELYQIPGIAQTCNMGQTKAHYYTSHESIHPRRYIPIGPEIDFDAPHGRQSLT